MRSLEAKSMCSCVSIIIKKRNQKENNKAIIVDIASPWDHRVYEKEGEKIEKYQDLKRDYYYYYYYYYYY